MFFYKFSKPGVFPYFCVVHPIMIGEVIVENEKIWCNATTTRIGRRRQGRGEEE
jgi:hypothetical protein